LVDAGEERLLDLEILGERLEDQVGLADRLVEVAVVGADRHAVADAQRLRHVLSADQPLAGLFGRARQQDDVTPAGGKHLGAPRAHGAVRTENYDSLDVDHTPGAPSTELSGWRRNAKLVVSDIISGSKTSFPGPDRGGAPAALESAARRRYGVGGSVG